MNIYDVLYSMNTGNPTPKARPFDNLLGQALSGGTEEKTIDFTPVISVSDAVGGNALDYQFKITAKQTGTNPSPTNICPIDGWTGAQITRAWKNLFQTTASSTEMAGVTYTVNDDGTVSVSGTASGFSSFNMGEADISNVGAKKITISGIATATNIQWSNIRLYDSNNLVVYETLSLTAPSVTIDLANYPTAVKVVPIVKRQSNVSTSGVIKPMVEIGDTAHDFVQYETPTVYPVSWQTEAGTVYGGTLDVTTGTLTVTHAIVDLGSISGGWSKNAVAQGTLWRKSNVPNNGMQPQGTDFLCTAYKTVQSRNRSELTISCALAGYVDIINSDYDNSDDFKASLDGIMLVYPLREPVTYTLTPTEITLSEGANTIWADTGDSKLTYLAKK